MQLYSLGYLLSIIRVGIDRLVEDLIQESIAKGEFTNLKGTGKPLQNQNHNPYIDVVTHKINQVEDSLKITGKGQHSGQHV